MPEPCLIALGALAAILNLVGLYPYVRDTVKKDRTTKPERAMWWIYAALSALLLVAQAKSGAGWLLLVTGAYVLSTSVIAILSVKYGYGKFHKRDAISLAFAAVGAALWWLSNDPLMAIIMVVIVDFTGSWLTLVKTWCAPHTETLISWQISIVAAFVSIFSVGTWSLAVLVYPVYAVFGAVLMVWIIVYRRTKVAVDPLDF